MKEIVYTVRQEKRSYFLPDSSRCVPVLFNNIIYSTVCFLMPHGWCTMTQQVTNKTTAFSSFYVTYGLETPAVKMRWQHWIKKKESQACLEELNSHNASIIFLKGCHQKEWGERFSASVAAYGCDVFVTELAKATGLIHVFVFSQNMSGPELISQWQKRHLCDQRSIT